MEPVLARDLRFSWTQTDIFIESYKTVITAAVRTHDFFNTEKVNSLMNKEDSVWQMDVQLTE